VYLSSRNVPVAADAKQLERLIDEYLSGIRAARTKSMLTANSDSNLPPDDQPGRAR
jgi:hypothetical protein